jgi:protease-4
VAVVTMDGDISDESVAPVRSEILSLLKDKQAKALVLRVNSPGGSAMASEVLWEALDEWKNSKKPYVVSMGGVAASGGYYIAAGADRIFAEDGTITGSIGVVGMKFVVGEAMENIGITSHSTQRGRNAGVMSMTRGFTEEEAALVRQSMTDVYATFKKRITDGRGEALKNELEALAGGRVFSGREALEIGLVDEIGGLAEAIRHITEKADLEEPDVLLLPEPKSMLDGLFSPETGRKDDEIVRAGTPRSSHPLKLSLLDSTLLDALPVSTRQDVGRLFSRMEHFREQRVLLLGPDLNLRMNPSGGSAR